MLLLALALVVAISAILTIWEWRRTKTLSSHAVTRLQARVAEKMSLEEWVTANNLLRRLEKRGSGDHHTEILRIQLLRRTKQWGDAMEAIRTASHGDRCSLLVMREKAKLLLATGDVDGAYDAFQHCHAVLRDEEDLISLAQVLYHQSEVDEALETLAPLLELAQSGELLALAGDCHFAKREDEEALALYRRAGEGDNLARIGHCLRRLCRFREAEEYFYEILRLKPKNLSATLSLGACLEARGLYAKALHVYQHGKAWEGGDARLFRQAGFCAVHTDRFDYAEAYLLTAIERGLCSPQVLAFLGYALERQAKWSEAEGVYVKLTEEHPGHVAGPRGMAWLFGVGLSQMISPNTGLEMARRCIELIPDVVSWELLSACEARSGNFAEAHAILERLLVQEKDRATALRRQKAMRILRKRLPLDENHLVRSLVA